MATETSVMAVIRAARPFYRNAHDKIAYALHATFLASGFTLNATGNSAFSYTTGPSSSEQEEVGTDGWNELEDCFGFVYTKTAKGIKKSFLVKCLVMGDNLVIDALPLGDNLEEPFNLQINVNDYVSNESSSSTNYGKLYENLPGLVKKLQTSIINKLENMGKLNSSTSTTKRSEATHRGEGSESNLNLPPTRLITEHQPLSSRVGYPPVLPVVIDDLLPGAGAGIYPMRGGFGSGGSMLIGPNDPRWAGIGGEQPGFPGGGIPGVPPGARFDPYGPSGVPGFEPARFIRNPQRPGGRTHPDLEHFGGSDFI